ncbi:hypothetical protein E2542_SST18813 [Spatholobus suberectus]|nr:hypothetical protein E2542_SST18813 [Spatholobus suberectus]
MKILKWMHKKLNWSSEKRKPNPFSATYQSSVTEPHALLVIGTFGNNNLKENSGNTNATAVDSSSQDCVLEFTLKNLGNEFNIYFQELVKSIEQKEKEIFSDGSNSNGGNFYPNRSHCLDNSKSVIGTKALVFLLKKMFVCRSGFQPIPSFKDPLSVESGMEKILRAMLHKKLCAQGSIVVKKDLENEHMPTSDNDKEELTTDAEDGRKWDTWDRTDSEYIVLEI